MLWGGELQGRRRNPAGASLCSSTPARTGLHFLDGVPVEACSAGGARYDRPLVFRMIAPSTTRSKNAIANGGSPRYSPHASKSMFATNAVDRPLRALISLYSKLAAWGDS